MFKSILEYDVRRKAHPLRKPGLREPNGKPSRRAKAGLPYAVYFMRPKGSALLKIGQTGNLHERLKGYRAHSGVPVMYSAMLMVAGAADARRLEAFAISMAARQYNRGEVGREWFVIPAPDMVDFVEAVIAGSPVNLVSVAGGLDCVLRTRLGNAHLDLPDVEDEEPTLHARMAREACQIARLYGAKRGRV